MCLFRGIVPQPGLWTQDCWPYECNFSVSCRMLANSRSGPVGIFYAWKSSVFLFVQEDLARYFQSAVGFCGKKDLAKIPPTNLFCDQAIDFLDNIQLSETFKLTCTVQYSELNYRLLKPMQISIDLAQISFPSPVFAHWLLHSLEVDLAHLNMSPRQQQWQQGQTFHGLWEILKSLCHSFSSGGYSGLTQQDQFESKICQQSEVSVTEWYVKFFLRKTIRFLSCWQNQFHILYFLWSDITSGSFKGELNLRSLILTFQLNNQRDSKQNLCHFAASFSPTFWPCRALPELKWHHTHHCPFITFLLWSEAHPYFRWGN